MDTETKQRDNRAQVKEVGSFLSVNILLSFLSNAWKKELSQGKKWNAPNDVDSIQEYFPQKSGRRMRTKVPGYKSTCRIIETKQ